MSRFSHPANDGNDLLTAPAGDPRRTADRLYRVQRLSEDVASRAEALGAAVRAGGVDPLRDIVGETGVLALTATISARPPGRRPHRSGGAEGIPPSGRGCREDLPNSPTGEVIT